MKSYLIVVLLSVAIKLTAQCPLPLPETYTQERLYGMKMHCVFTPRLVRSENGKNWAVFMGYFPSDGFVRSPLFLTCDADLQDRPLWITPIDPGWMQRVESHDTCYLKAEYWRYIRHERAELQRLIKDSIDAVERNREHNFIIPKPPVCDSVRVQLPPEYLKFLQVSLTDPVRWESLLGTYRSQNKRGASRAV